MRSSSLSWTPGLLVWNLPIASVVLRTGQKAIRTATVTASTVVEAIGVGAMVLALGHVDNVVPRMFGVSTVAVLFEFGGMAVSVGVLCSFIQASRMPYWQVCLQVLAALVVLSLCPVHQRGAAQLIGAPPDVDPRRESPRAILPGVRVHAGELDPLGRQE